MFSRIKGNSAIDLTGFNLNPNKFIQLYAQTASTLIFGERRNFDWFPSLQRDIFKFNLKNYLKINILRVKYKILSL
jgi:hypothetical protein